MSKVNTICLRCGTVQVRSDLVEILENNDEDKYMILEEKKMCPKCKIKTNQIATKDIKMLKKSLETNPNKKLDSYILKLIKR